MSPILVNKLPIRRLTIVGAGLMGGSLARALRPSLDHLALIDANPHTRQAAAGLADLITDDLAAGVAGADMVILATPVRAILRLLTELPAARPDGCLLMDLGSAKTAVCQAMSSLPPTFQSIGGHPMCGKETAGFAAADPHLYQNQTFVLCRNGRTTSHIEQTALAIVAHIGSHPLFLPPDVHDR
ncbi:MAG: prephenate dehydrogenase, partial [Anaerolineae bacterium]